MYIKIVQVSREDETAAVWTDLSSKTHTDANTRDQRPLLVHTDHQAATQSHRHRVTTHLPVTAAEIYTHAMKESSVRLRGAGEVEEGEGSWKTA